MKILRANPVLFDKWCVLTNAAGLTRKQNSKLQKITLQMTDERNEFWTPFGDDKLSTRGIIRIPNQSFILHLYK